MTDFKAAQQLLNAVPKLSKGERNEKTLTFFHHKHKSFPLTKKTMAG